MQASDGAFSTPTENVYLDIPLATVRLMTDGPHTLYVRGKDAAGTWGSAGTTVLVIDKTGPSITATVTPNPTYGATTATLTATVTDPLSSVSSIEWFVGADPGVGNATQATAGPGGTISGTFDVTGLPEGIVSVTVRARDSLGNTSTAVRQLRVQPLRPLWFSTLGSTNVPGVAGAGDDSDIYSWGGSGLSRALDMSVAPYRVPATANIDGYSRGSGTTFYASFTNAVNLPGLPVNGVQDEDVVFWNGSAWSLYFDGSARGVGAYDLDAISVRGGSLYFSVDTNTSPPGAGGTGDDSDIYRWNGLSSYTRVVDATTIGISAAANVDGFVWISPTDWAFSFSGDTNVTGLGATQDEDVVSRTGTAWSVYFDGTAHGLTTATLDVDAFDIP
jgi:hypothetical protein